MLGEQSHREDGACNFNCNFWGVALLHAFTFIVSSSSLEASNFPIKILGILPVTVNQFLCVQWKLLFQFFNLIILHFSTSKNCVILIDFINSLFVFFSAPLLVWKWPMRGGNRVKYLGEIAGTPFTRDMHKLTVFMDD